MNHNLISPFFRGWEPRRRSGFFGRPPGSYDQGLWDRQTDSMEEMEQQLAAMRTMEEAILLGHPEPRAGSNESKQLATIRAAAGAISASVAAFGAAATVAAPTGAAAADDERAAALREIAELRERNAALTLAAEQGAQRAHDATVLLFTVLSQAQALDGA